MNIEQKLVSSVIGGLKALYGQDVPAAQVQLQKTKKEFEDTSRWLYSLFSPYVQERTGADGPGNQ